MHSISSFMSKSDSMFYPLFQIAHFSMNYSRFKDLNKI